MMEDLHVHDDKINQQMSFHLIFFPYITERYDILIIILIILA